MPVATPRSPRWHPTEKHERVFQLWLEGYSYRKIGWRFDISRTTVGQYVQDYLTFLGTHDKPEARRRWWLRQAACFSGVPSGKR